MVSPADNAEVRRVSVANGGSRTREIDLTSYAELALAPPAAEGEVQPAPQPQLALTGYNPGETFIGTCPDCASQLEFAEGCMKCHVCGYSECG
jgi:ribonucleoside-diphosphate reductase alpha chain